MRSSLISIIILVVVFSFTVMPFSASAGIVPCGVDVNKDGIISDNEACGVCDVFVLADNIINFTLLKLAMPIGVIMLLVGGLYMVTAGGSEDKVKTGKKYLTSALIGLVLAFSGWLIVNAIMVSLVKPKGGEAGQIKYPSSIYLPWSDISRFCR